jgi:hypothetical protein
MVTELKVTRKRRGNYHVLSSRQFIIDYLRIVGEDYGANIHRAYKEELKRLAAINPKRVRNTRQGVKILFYHKPSFSSFNKVMNLLKREGVIEFTGREEESDNPMFANMEWKPLRRYYRVKS